MTHVECSQKLSFRKKNKKSKIYWEQLKQPNKYTELILTDWMEQSEFCFAFSYVTKKFSETNDFQDNVVGQGPIIVDCRNGAITETGSNVPYDTFLENYENRSDPYKNQGCVVLILKEGTDVNRISAVRSIRKHTALGLKSAKSCIDILSGGGSVEVKANSVKTAIELAEDLKYLQYEVDQI